MNPKELLDPEIPINLELLDEVCQKFNKGDKESIDTINEFINREDAWTVFTDVIEGEFQEITKITMFNVIKTFISTKWNLLDDDQKSSLRDIFIEMITSWPGEVSNALVEQANLGYVILMLNEWSADDNQYLRYILDHSTDSADAALNSLHLLKTLFQECIENSENRVTKKRANEIIMALSGEADEMFNLIVSIMSETDESQIIIAALDVIKYFIAWVSTDCIAEADFLSTLMTLLQDPTYSASALNTISTIFSNPDLPNAFESLAQEIYLLIISALDQAFDSDIDFRVEDETLTSALAEVLNIFLGQIYSLIEIDEGDFPSATEIAVNWIGMLLMCDGEVFRTAVDTWHKCISRRVNKKNPMDPTFAQIYDNVAFDVASVLIERMPKPPEVTIEYNKDDGRIVKAAQLETVESELFKTVRQSMVMIASINIDPILDILGQKNLEIQREFVREKFNSLVWSIGVISGSMKPDVERQFLVSILDPMIAFCDSCPDIEIRATIAAGIMYICAQYPRLICGSPEFFQMIVFKLFDFMHQDVPGIKEMAVNIFKIIGKRTKQMFCTTKGFPRPFILEVLDHLDEIVEPLNMQLRANILDTLSSIATGFSNDQGRIGVMQTIMGPLIELLDSYGGEDPYEAAMENVQYALDCFGFISSNLPLLFHEAFQHIFDMLCGIVERYTGAMLEMAQSPYPSHQRLLQMQRVKAAAIGVMHSYMDAITGVKQDPQVIFVDYIDAILNMVVDELQATTEQPLLMEGDEATEEDEIPFKPLISALDARVPESISFVVAMAEQMPDLMAERIGLAVGEILTAVTPMLGKSYNFYSFQGFRLPLFRLIEVACQKYFEPVITAFGDPEMIVNAIVRGCDHPSAEICSASLRAMLAFFENGPMDENWMPSYTTLIVHAFVILTDATHKNCFDDIVNTIDVALAKGLYNGSTVAGLIVDIFPNCQVQTLEEYMNGLLEAVSDQERFLTLTRDLLVQSKVFLPTDQELRAAEAEQLKRSTEEMIEHIPGINGPAEAETSEFLE